MDAPSLVVVALVVLGLIFGPRFVLESVGRTGDGLAALFVPPDRSLGWPRGVQEADEPWGWHVIAGAEPANGLAGLASDGMASTAATASIATITDVGEIAWSDVVNVRAAPGTARPSAGLTVPVARVQRIRS